MIYCNCCEVKERSCEKKMPFGGERVGGLGRGGFASACRRPQGQSPQASGRSFILPRSLKKFKEVLLSFLL